MKKVVLACHCLEVLALTIWVGGLIAIIASVIPAVFNTIGMEAGGRVLTRTFQGYDRLVLGAALIVVAGMLVRGFGPKIVGASGGIKEAVGSTEPHLIGIMIAIASLLAFYLNPEVARLQETAFGVKEVAAKRVAYEHFFFYHRVARALYLVNLGLGIAVLCVKVRKWAR